MFTLDLQREWTPKVSFPAGVIAPRTLCRRKAKCNDHGLQRDLRASLRGKIFMMGDAEEKSELLI